MQSGSTAVFFLNPSINATLRGRARISLIIMFHLLTIQVSQLRELIEVKEVIFTSPHAQLRELIEVKEVITPYGRSGI